MLMKTNAIIADVIAIAFLMPEIFLKRVNSF
jgi:hypothetical protein